MDAIFAADMDPAADNSTMNKSVSFDIDFTLTQFNAEYNVNEAPANQLVEQNRP